MRGSDGFRAMEVTGGGGGGLGGEPRSAMARRLQRRQAPLRGRPPPQAPEAAGERRLPSLQRELRGRQREETLTTARCQGESGAPSTAVMQYLSAQRSLEPPPRNRL